VYLILGKSSFAVGMEFCVASNYLGFFLEKLSRALYLIFF
jgi:hypothetical protein